MTKKSLIAVTLTVCFLAALLLRTVPTSSSSTIGEYDPWRDINDDGVINILDVVEITTRYATTGLPVNKTALLYNVNATLTSLLERIASINASLLTLLSSVTALQTNLNSLNASMSDVQALLATLEGNVSALETDVANLHATDAQLSSRLDALNATLTLLETRVAALETGGFVSMPAYDSGWVDVTSMAGKNITLIHNLNDSAVSVEIWGRMTADGGAHQKYLGLTGYSAGWSKTYGGTNNDFGRSVIRTSDGGYALAGYTYSSGAGNADVYLVKLDSVGNMLWSKTYGGTGVDMGFSVVQTSDGGYAIGGETNSYGAGNYDVYLVKTNSNGNMLWNKTYGGTTVDVGYSLVQTRDGGYAVGGETSSFGAGGYDFYLVKTDSSGNLQWSKTYGGTGTDIGYSLVQTNDVGYALTGETGSYGAGSYDVYLVKADSSGNTQWGVTYGGTGTDIGFSVVPTSDGGYAIGGETNSYGAGNYDVYLVKANSTGGTQWSKTYGGLYADVGYSVVQTREGGYALVGDTYSFGAGDSDFYLVKADSVGNMQWSKTYGGASTDIGYSVVQTGDGGYMLAGFTYSYGAGNYDVWLVKTDVELGLAQTNSTPNSVTLYRGATDLYWNYVRVRIWRIKQNP